MTPTWQTADGSIRLYLGDCLDVLPTLESGSVDAVVTDPPFSARTHKGHDMSANGHAGFGHDGSDRKPLGYAPWADADVSRAMPLLCRVSRGWVVAITDHVLALPIQAEMERAGRYAFAPLPWYVPGSRVRLSGDGPSSWTAWIVVCRTAAQVRWGTLPGGYMHRGEQCHMGGKPVELMAAIVGDYSREGDVVADPYMGSGTTGVACVQSGRSFIGCEIDPVHFATAVRRIEAELNRAPLFEKPPVIQRSLIA